MIKIIGTIALLAGAIMLVVGVLGIFGSLSTGLSPWAFAILGVIFFFAGTSLLKNRKDTDAINADK
ncbi:hypothetical protein EAX61_05880 [Dokdonia sinensis]|uniref:Uncharacterized protein n=1 Tax=Dokdonia sinensis TaxID=2479847 RepID=A0A3M0G9B0_9FLAO|nr:hypothetical protein [Dokdonia sinensis]RMB61008.1 hypothetical protein EAX61_05880 [Dokdonia sinensis]